MPPGGLYLEGRFNRGFCVTSLGAYNNLLEGLIHGGAYFRNFTELDCSFYEWIIETTNEIVVPLMNSIP